MLHCRLAALMAAETPFTYDTQLASLQFTYKSSTVNTFVLHSRLAICLSAKFAYKHATVLGSPQCWPAGNGCVTDTCQLLAICMIPPALDICLAYNQSHDNPFPYSFFYCEDIVALVNPNHYRWEPESKPVHRSQYPQACPPKPISDESRDSSTSSTLRFRFDCSFSNSAIFKRKAPV